MFKYLPLLWANLGRKRLRTSLTIASIIVAFLLFGLGNLVGSDYRMQKVYDLIEAVGPGHHRALVPGLREIRASYRLRLRMNALKALLKLARHVIERRLDGKAPRLDLLAVIAGHGIGPRLVRVRVDTHNSNDSSDGNQCCWSNAYFRVQVTE